MPLKSKTGELTSMLSTSTDVAMNELSTKWMVSVVKNLKHLPDGPTQKFMEMPERKMSKPLKYVYKCYTQILKIKELEANFECTVGVSDIVETGE